MVTESRHAVHGQDASRPEKRFSTVEVIRFILGALILASVVVFSLVNTTKVRVDYVFGKSDLPLIVIIAASGLAGIVLAALIVRSRH